jgi:multidrug efflux pump subunit AcrA (membrane-fusion protein)
MAVKVAFRVTGSGEAGRLVVIPKSSVRNLDGRDVVFVVQKDRAERRAVTVGSAQDQDVVLSAGVSAGETVIVDSPEGLADGVRVREMKP